MKANLQRLAALAARNKLATVGGALLASAGAHAQSSTFTIDSAAIVSTISAGVATISAIGIAVLSLVVVIKLFKWVQRVL